MSARVKIPIRLRVDPEALAGDRVDLEDALAKALARAIGKAREQVVLPRGGALPVRAIAPTFSWGGAAVAQVPAHARAATEAHVRRLIEDAIVQGGLLARPDDIPEVLPPSPSEVAQPDRVRVGAYAMPSYGEDEEILAALLRARDVVHPEEFDFDWYVPQDQEDFVFAFARVLTRELGALPTSGYYGAIVRGGWSEKNANARAYNFLIFDVSKCDFAHPQTVQTVTGFRSEIASTRFNARTHQFDDGRSIMPVRGEYVFKRVWPIATLDQRIEYITLAEGDGIRSEVMKSSELSPHADENVAIAIKNRAALISPTATVMMEITTPQAGHVSVARSSELPNLPPLPISFFPIVFSSVRSEEEKKGKGEGDGTGKDTKSGGGGGAGQGQKKGGGGGEFHEGQSEDGEAGDGGGGYIVDPGAEGSGGAFRFPGGAGAWDPIVCEPFEDEPTVDEWPDAEAMKRLIRIIAARLQIPECQYPGTFCINAARVIGARAAGIGETAVSDTAFTSELKPRDNFIVKPLPTIAIQFLRHLGATVPYLTRLQQYFFQPRGSGWMLHFLKEYSPTLRESVGWIFVFACQIAFLQQLRYSKTQIEARIAKLHTGYGDFFEETVVQLLTDTATLGLMREDLTSFLAGNLESGDAVARWTIDAWRRGHRGDALQQELLADRAAVPDAVYQQPASWQDAQDQVIELAKPPEQPAPAAIDVSKAPGTFAKKGKAWAIRDQRGRLWTLADLDLAVQLQTTTAESIDPLVKQILDLDGIVPLFQANPWMIQPHLERLLGEMKDKNAEITGEVSDDAMWAFKHGPFSEDIEHATVPYGKYVLGGIHLNAHSLIYDAFSGDEEYAESLNYLFDSEMGLRDIKEFFLIGGILILAVLCPEAAAVLGILAAASEEADAEEMKDVYRALIDPDVVIGKAELEIMQFMAELMLAVSIIPEAGSIMKGATGLAEAAIKGTVKEFAKEALEAILKSVLKQLSKNLILAFAKEIVILEVFQTLMTKLAVPLQKAILETRSLPAGATPISAADLGLTTAADVLGEVDSIDQITTVSPAGKDD